MNSNLFVLKIAERLRWIESRKAGATDSELRALEKARAELDHAIAVALRSDDNTGAPN